MSIEEKRSGGRARGMAMTSEARLCPCFVALSCVTPWCRHVQAFKPRGRAKDSQRERETWREGEGVIITNSSKMFSN